VTGAADAGIAAVQRRRRALAAAGDADIHLRAVLAGTSFLRRQLAAVS
jgi:hypothetical protein